MRHPLQQDVAKAAQSAAAALVVLADAMSPGAVSLGAAAKGDTIAAQLQAQLTEALGARKGRRLKSLRLLVAVSLLTGDARWSRVERVARSVCAGKDVGEVTREDVVLWCGVSDRTGRRVFHAPDDDKEKRSLAEQAESYARGSFYGGRHHYF